MAQYGPAAALGEAIRQDMIEGGRLFIRHLEAVEAGTATASGSSDRPS
jgi:hypothetical protein